MAVPVRRQSWSISIHFVVIHASAAKNRQTSLKFRILGLKVIQGHRC